MTAILANTAVPVFFPQPLLMMAALIPVVIIETFLLKQRFPVKVSQVFITNVISTLWGLPLAYLTAFLFTVGLTGADRDWVNYGLSSRILTNMEHDWYLYPAAVLSVVAPCFLLSVYIEGKHWCGHIFSVPRKAIWTAVTRAHFYSYATLLALDFLWIRAMLK